jgi:sec-independent protein translocase protein TatB
MFFDIGWPELMLIGVVALVVIGPKDLPRALRIAGYWVRKARNMSREFQNSIDQMIREAELDDIRRDLKKATELDVEHEVHKTIDPDGTLAESIKPPNLPDYFTENSETATAASHTLADGSGAATLPAAVAPEAVPAEGAAEPPMPRLGAIEAAPEAGVPAPQPLPAKS